MRIAVIEDDDLAARAIAMSIRDLGHEVVGPFRSMGEVAALADEEAPEIAFVDLRLGPGRSGARIDRHLSERFGTVSVYVTGDPTLAVRSGTYAVGYIPKPVSRAQLEAAIAYMARIRDGSMPKEMPAGMVRLEPTGAMTSA